MGYAAYRIGSQGALDEARPADAVVGLGAAQFNGTPGGVFEARLRHAVDLYEQHLAGYLIVTGGKLPGDHTTEAGAARAWAIPPACPAEASRGEDGVRNPLEPIEAVGAILRQRGFTSAIFVSDETH